jgi:hypothetical protein
VLYVVGDDITSAFKSTNSATAICSIVLRRAADVGRGRGTTMGAMDE